MRSLRSTSCIPFLVAISVLSAAGCSPGKEPIPFSAADGVIVITLDTLRADRLGTYGYDRPTSPELDAFAAESVVFDSAFAQYPSTMVSHLSAFTGLYPREHGVIQRKLSLSPTLPTVAEVFKKAGFSTAAFTENGMISPASGLGRGFDQFIYQHIGPPNGPDQVFDMGLQFLSEQSDPSRVFLWLHTYAVHTPYQPTAGNRELFLDGVAPPTVPVTGEFLSLVNRDQEQIEDADVAAFSRLYDGQLRDVDTAFGRFLQQLKESGWLDRLAIVVFADHGEEFREHGMLVHEQVYPELTRIPLMIRHPSLPAQRVESTVETIDMAPTLAGLAGLDWQPVGSGRSLLPGLLGKSEESTPQVAYAEMETGLHQRTVVQSIGSDLWQLIEHRFPAGPDGVWFSTIGEFDVQGTELDLNLYSYRKRRSLKIWLDGELFTELQIAPDWSQLTVPLPKGCFLCRVRLEAKDCATPEETTTRMTGAVWRPKWVVMSGFVMSCST